MYDETYEKYIRSILGYPTYTNNFNSNYMAQQTYVNNNQNIQIEDCYPEIYKIIYPMIKTRCANQTLPINSETIDQMTEEIYSAMETEKEIITKDEVKKVENRGEDRQLRNRNLQDLIKILIIRELLGRPGNRPQMQPPHTRPPFLGAPITGRFPTMPRGDEIFQDLYEY